jgi:hypothetical protein
MEIIAESFVETLRYCLAFAATPKDKRHALNAVALDIDGSRVTAVATNAARVAWVELSPDSCCLPDGLLSLSAVCVRMFLDDVKRRKDWKTWKGTRAGIRLEGRLLMVTIGHQQHTLTLHAPDLPFPAHWRNVANPAGGGGCAPAAGMGVDPKLLAGCLTALAGIAGSAVAMHMTQPRADLQTVRATAANPMPGVSHAAFVLCGVRV